MKARCSAALLLSLCLLGPAERLSAQTADSLAAVQSLGAALSPEDQTVQWASELIGFSSQASPKVFSASQALGKPRKLPATGISEVAWMPDMRSRLPEEWIKVGFAEPQKIRQVIIGESARPGAIHDIFLFDGDRQALRVYHMPEDGILEAPDSGALSRVVFEESPFAVSAVMLLLKSRDSLAIHQIDAIGIAAHEHVVQARIRQLPQEDQTAEPENMGPYINSFYDEVFPVISPDGRTLYFDRKNHPQNLGLGNHDDIWISEMDSSGKWTLARNAGPPLNNSFHNFVCSISPDGNTLVLGNVYHPDGRMGSGVSMSLRTREGWSEPKPIPIEDYYNLDDYGEYQLAANGQVLLMAIEREDSYGKRDLYASFRMGDGKFSTPLHMGPDINSAGLEMSPFLAPDMKTLFFSSNGFPGYGRNDMFMSRRLDESWTRWTEPLNLGNTLNSGEMDAYYTISAEADYAYFASANRSIGRADIFRVALPRELQPEPVVLLRGRVLDMVSGAAVEADIRYFLSELEPTGQQESSAVGTSGSPADSLAGEARSAPESGQYRVTLPVGERYRLLAQSEGYFALEERLDLSKTDAYGELKQDLMLVPIRKGQIIPLKEIFFQVNSDSLLPGSFRELDRVAALLHQTPALQIEIGGHTNDRCSASFCLELSRKRARSVARYLYDKGLDINRVKWVGYGSKKPVADNASEEGRLQNQRVEFSILDTGQEGD